MRQPIPVEPIAQRVLVFEYIADAVLFIAADGLISDCNPGAEQMFGFKRAELIGAALALVFGKQEAADFCEGMRSGSGNNGRWQGRLSFVNKTGQQGRTQTLSVPLENAGGYLTIHREVTEAEQIESKFVEERLLLRSLIDAVPDPIFCKDREGRFLLHNKADQAMMGTSGDESLGKTVFDYPDLAEHAGRYFADDMSVVESGVPVINREEPFLRADNYRGWFLTSKYPLRNKLGDIIGLVGIARDITERKAVDQKLDEDERLLRTLIDAIPDLIFFKDSEGRHLVVNAADSDLFGVAGAEGLGKTVFEWPIPPEIAASYAADDRRVLETGQPLINREERFETADGHKGWFLTSKFPLRNAAGEIYGLVGVSRDVTEFRVTTEELQRARQRLDEHVDNSPLAVTEWDPELRLVRWTGRAEGLFGWSAQEVVGKYYSELPMVHPADLSRVTECINRLLDGRDGHNVSVNRNLTRDGAVIYCIWHNSALRDAEGRLVSILSLTQDVSEQTLADQTILENERLYHAIIETTNTGYVLSDKNGCLLDANSEFLRMLGYPSLAKGLGRPFTDWIAPHALERSKLEFERLMREGSSLNFETDFVALDGTIVPVEANARVRHSPSGVQVIAFFRNISARRRAESERQAFERKLLETQKLESLGILAGGIAHDFNNLLTGVLGNASLARLDAGEDSPLQPYLEQIEVAAVRAADLCRQMLAYSGKGSFVVHRLDLNAVVEETAKLLKISISKKAVVCYELASGLPPVVGDITQIRQVIMNLVLNAAEAVGERSGHIWVTTSLLEASLKLPDNAQFPGSLGAGAYICFEVRDDGLGMTPETQARIFDPFFTTKFAGRGLGLAAVQGIVRGHKGQLLVQSEPGKGTRFRVYLPCAVGVAEAPPVEVPASPTWRGCGNVLVIDDESTVRVTTSHMLEALGFSVRVAPDGREGIKRFSEADGALALVMLDLTMPHVDGDVVLHEIRRIDPDARVLLMSGFDEAEVLSRFDGLEVAGFLQKPFLLPALRQKLQQILGPSGEL